MSGLNALVGVDFSLLRTKMYAAYEKNGNEGYSVLLMPTAQESDNSVTLGDIIAQINQVSGNMGTKGEGTGATDESTAVIDPDNMEEMISKKLDLGEGNSIDNIKFKLCMAYLYLDKKNGEDAQVEYAFKLEILTENVVPEAVADIIDVDRVMISVWKTDRPKVISEMALISVKEFIEG